MTADAPPPAMRSISGGEGDLALPVVLAMAAELPSGGLRLTDMADIAHLSPYHFIRVFRRATGLTPGAFQAALRLAEAKRRLQADPGLPVTELCFDLGFASLGTFVARFTAAVGLSPSRYRRLTSGLRIPPAAALPDILSPARPAGLTHTVAGELAGTPAGPGPVFIGLFPRYLPQGLPVAGTTRQGDGPFAIESVPDGTYAVLAAGCPGDAGLAPALLHGRGVRVAGLAPVHVVGGRTGPLRIRLRDPSPTDPPVLIALPLLLARAIARWEKRTASAAG